MHVMFLAVARHTVKVQIPHKPQFMTLRMCVSYSGNANATPCDTMIAVAVKGQKATTTNSYST